ncbi:hypothetical protein F0562_033387 [Nyssa sinensis]|uniref:Uncharacterized protein n=1 Tax=Nyssa sinensis TaxID=561372 RepID=A0A5J5ARA2_9ASTE|nr:hypothetical protein F0562_033387 [Nyssa sinensis]
MKAHGINGSSADQWAYHAPENKRNDAMAKFKTKVSDKLEKTKVAASIGKKKVKEGVSAGIQWIKDKSHKTTQ